MAGTILTASLLNSSSLHYYNRINQFPTFEHKRMSLLTCFSSKKKKQLGFMDQILDYIEGTRLVVHSSYTWSLIFSICWTLRNVYISYRGSKVKEMVRGTWRYWKRWEWSRGIRNSRFSISCALLISEWPYQPLAVLFAIWKQKKRKLEMRY